jgi:hypothetical protein
VSRLSLRPRRYFLVAYETTAALAQESPILAVLVHLQSLECVAAASLGIIPLDEHLATLAPGVPFSPRVFLVFGGRVDEVYP